MSPAPGERPAGRPAKRPCSGTGEVNGSFYQTESKTASVKISTTVTQGGNHSG